MQNRLALYVSICENTQKCMRVCLPEQSLCVHKHSDSYATPGFLLIFGLSRHIWPSTGMWTYLEENHRTMPGLLLKHRLRFPISILDFHPDH